MSDDNRARLLRGHPKWPGWQIGMVEAETGEAFCPRNQQDDFAKNTPDLANPATNGWLLQWLSKACVVCEVVQYNTRGRVYIEWRDVRGVRHSGRFPDAVAALLTVWDYA